MNQHFWTFERARLQELQAKGSLARMTIGFESTEIKEERWSPDMEPAQEKEGGATVGEIHRENEAEMTRLYLVLQYMYYLP